MNVGLHIGFCFIDILYIPYGILYYVNRIYVLCLLTPHFGEVCNILDFALKFRDLNNAFHVQYINANTMQDANDPLEYCANLSLADYMTPEIISIFAALIVHIIVLYLLLRVIDVKADGGSAKDAFSCSKVRLCLQVGFGGRNIMILNARPR